MDHKVAEELANLGKSGNVPMNTLRGIRDKWAASLMIQFWGHEEFVEDACLFPENGARYKLLYFAEQQVAPLLCEEVVHFTDFCKAVAKIEQARVTKGIAA